MSKSRRLLLVLGLWIGCCAVAAEVPWQLEEWREPPAVYAADDMTFDFPVPASVRPIFYEGVAFEGRPTRVFAWLGIPKNAAGPLPAMVLVHGGGGSAFADWVAYWNRRGYVAIAMDTGGCIPTASFEGAGIRRGHDRQAGPGDDIFAIDRPLTDRWPYHAVAAAVLANSLLRSLPEVDSDRIGITGISWGGVVTCVAAALDERFRFAAPVYGCGYIRELRALYGDTPVERIDQWMELWDPERWLPYVTIPILFVNGAADPAFHVSAWEKSTMLPGGPVYRSLYRELIHCHRFGMAPEVRIFADWMLKGEGVWPQLLHYGVSGDKFSAQWEDGFELERAELIYSTGADSGWQTAPAALTGAGAAEAELPPGTTACWLNVVTLDRAILSTPWVEMDHNEK